MPWHSIILFTFANDSWENSWEKSMNCIIWSQKKVHWGVTNVTTCGQINVIIFLIIYPNINELRLWKWSLDFANKIMRPSHIEVSHGSAKPIDIQHHICKSGRWKGHILSVLKMPKNVLDRIFKNKIGVFSSKCWKRQQFNNSTDQPNVGWRQVPLPTIFDTVCIAFLIPIAYM